MRTRKKIKHENDTDPSKGEIEGTCAKRNKDCTFSKEVEDVNLTVRQSSTPRQKAEEVPFVPKHNADSATDE